MALKTEKNSSIFNSKNLPLPKAGLLALGIILGLEASSVLLMRAVRENCGGGNLARMDTDFFCRNFKPYCEADAPRNPLFLSKPYSSWEEMGKDGPYDSVAFGTSVADTGWVEMLQKQGVQILNTTRNPKFRDFLPQAVWSLLEHGPEINARPGALLIYCTLTDRGDLDFKIPEESFRRSRAPQLAKAGKKEAMETPFRNLWVYALKKETLRRAPEVKMPFWGGRREMLDKVSLDGLSRELLYSAEDERRLAEQFRIYRDEAAAGGFRFAFIAFPTKPQMYEWLLGPEDQGRGRRPNLEALRKACEANGIPFLDMEKELSSAARAQYSKDGSLLWQHCDTHINEEGSRLTAEKIAKFIAGITQSQ